MNKLKGLYKSQTFRLLLIILIAFIASLCFRRSAGIVAMLPIAFILCGVAAFIKVSAWQKAVIFGAMLFCVNTVESEMGISVMFTVIGVAAMLLFELSARMFYKNAGRGISLMAVSLVICVSVSFCMVGNPFSAFSARRQIDEHIGAAYPEAEGASIGELEFSSIYFDLDSGCYAVDATSSKYPTEIGRMRVSDGVLKDGFYTMMEKKLAVPYTDRFVDMLRSSFTSDSFTVEFERIVTRDGDSPLAAKDGELGSRMVYEITVGGIQTADAMLEAAEQYLRVIDDSGIEYGEIIFKSGVGAWYRRCIRAEYGHPEMGTPSLTRVHPGLSARANKYVEQIIGAPFSAEGALYKK